MSKLDAWRCLIALILAWANGFKAVDGLGVNWGTMASHKLPPKVVVQMLQDNGIKKVKLFDSDQSTMSALAGTDIEVMVAIPNDQLQVMGSYKRAKEWVQRNITRYNFNGGVNIKYVAVGNEPFLTSYNGSFINTTFPALQNVQNALNEAGYGSSIKATVPLNADVYQSDTGVPSGGAFRPDIHDLMVSIVEFLNENGAPLTINIYPFLSLNADPNFPIEFAFFDGNAAANPPLADGSIAYANVFDANYDTLISALEKIGYRNMPVVVGEVGWPSDGGVNANPQLARRFNQGLIDKINRGQGTPKSPKLPDIYVFSLIDEDTKSIEPGNFERHWGIFYFDGSIKYPLDLGNGKNLTAAKGVRYLARQWCVMAPDADVMDPSLGERVNFACTYADCTSLGYGSSCGDLDVRGNASYAFNVYYQTMDQRNGACEQFLNLSAVTRIDPGFSGGSCRYEVMIDRGRHEGRRKTPARTDASAGGGGGRVGLGRRVVGVGCVLVVVMIFWRW